MNEKHEVIWTLHIREEDVTTDVALCYASSKEEAMEKFSRLYSGFEPDDVHTARFNNYGICCVTGY